jgi:putative transposase
VRLAQDNRAWGYDRFVGALVHLGDTISEQTVANILQRHGIPPAPKRQPTTIWREVVRTHLDVFVATDCFTSEVWTWCGLVTYYVVFVIRISTREVHVAGMTPHPDQRWIIQMARNVTMAKWGFLSSGQDLILDRDGKFCPAFQQIIDAVGVTRAPLPARSPNLNAYAERWVHSVKDEALSQLIVCGEQALRHALQEYVPHDHEERPHQGKGNVVLFPAVSQDHEPAGPMQCCERLGGLLKYGEHEAA